MTAVVPPTTTMTAVVPPTTTMTAVVPPTTTKTTSIATAFTRKLYRMLDVEDATVIGWDATGRSFSIRDEVQLDDVVLPRYFRGRVDVFRQHLSEHGFRSTVTSVGQHQIESFFHEHFVRGEPNRLSLIVRVPTNKRRRSRLGKKRATPGVATPKPTQHDDMMDALASFIADDFDLKSFLQEPFPEVPSDQANGDSALHDRLANILALHAVNPVLASTSMLNSSVVSLDGGEVDSPLFSFEMMMSMVEWLDATV